MIVQILLLLLGLALLIKGADWFVKGASELAREYGISELAIGLTIVAFGTSAPELIVNVFAAVQDHQDIVLANVIGSNNFNLFIILGISGLIIPLSVQSSSVSKEIPLSLALTGLLYVLCNDFFSDSQELSRIDGAILLGLFILFLFYVYNQLRISPTVQKREEKSVSKLKIVALVVFGLAGLIAGGRFVVNNAVEMASAMGMSEKMIGMTIVAAGTSLPELATSVVAAVKKNSDIAVGNIIGSNIFNLSLILASSVLIKPISYNNSFDTDIYILFGGTVFLFLGMFSGKKKKLDRWEAALLLITYLGYSTYLIAKGG